MTPSEKTVAFDSTIALVQSLRSSAIIHLYLILYKNYRNSASFNVRVIRCLNHIWFLNSCRKTDKYMDLYKMTIFKFAKSGAEVI